VGNRRALTASFETGLKARQNWRPGAQGFKAKTEFPI
jgi:hypothetical protein